MTSATATVDRPYLAADSIKLPFAASIVGGLLCGVALTFGLRALDDSEAQTVAALASANTALTETNKELQRADRLSDLKQAGVAAAAALPGIERELNAANDISDERHREATRQALTPAVASLKAVSRLEALTPQTLSQWDALERDLVAQADALEAAQPLVSGLALENPIELPAAATRGAAEAGATVVEGAQSKLAAWEREVSKSKSQRRRKLQAIKDYRPAVASLLVQYRSARTDLAAWTAKVESQGATFSEAYDALASHKGKRDVVRTALAALNPPAVLESEHSRLVTVVDTAIDAMDSATDGIQERRQCIDDPFTLYCESYDETPAWNQFQARSDQISSEFPTAQSAWESAVGGYINRLKRDGGAPPMPEL